VSDKYDEEVAYLTEFSGYIHHAWNAANPLFGFVSMTGDEWTGDQQCGCLTQIRVGDKEAWLPELTKEIRADERIPTDAHDITVEDLPVFAEWQRKLDEIREERATKVVES